MRGMNRVAEYLASASTGPTITGGTVTESGGYRYHTFTSSDATGIVVTGSGVKTVNYILVGGGAAGGGWSTDPGNNGGGGAGGVIYSSVSLAAGNYPVIIGAGGTASSANYPASRNGNPSAWSQKTTVVPLSVTYTGNGAAASFKKMPRPAANGQSVYLGTAAWTPWATYQNLPAYLLGQLCTVEVNTTDDAQFTFNKTTRVYLLRDSTFGGVTLTGWTLYESGKNYLSNYGSTNEVYYRDFAGGTYAIDSTSALYFFVDTAAPNTTDWLVAQGGGAGGGYTNGSLTTGYSMAVWGGSGGGSSQKTNWWTTYTPANSGDYGVGAITGQGNAGGWQYRYSVYAAGPLSGTGGGGAGTRGPLNTLTNYNPAGTTYYGVTGGGAGAGYQWLNGTYYGGGGGGSTHEIYTGGVLQQPGGVGGGGNGSYYTGSTRTPGVDGSANTGGGGGAGGNSAAGRTGGSGILIIRYPI